MYLSWRRWRTLKIGADPRTLLFGLLKKLHDAESWPLLTRGSFQPKVGLPAGQLRHRPMRIHLDRRPNPTALK